MNKTTAINIIKNLDTTYLNQDQKRLALKIINSFDEKEDLDALLSFILKRIKIGFTFDETFEVAEGHIALVNQLVDKNINIKNNNLATENENKLIIGENYEALKNLLLTYKEKIDIIYIDPPYNTESAAGDGNNLSSKEGQASKFIYKDKFGRNGWLNMMNERLQLAKKLLSEDGVIFVSIDDNEQAYLKVLMDEIFGEENFITTFIIDKTAQGANQSKNFKKQHEFLHLYSKNIEKFNIEINISSKRDEKKYKFKDDFGWYSITNSFDSINSPLEKNKNRGYTIYYEPKKNEVIIKDEYNKDKKNFNNYDNDLINKGFVPIRPSIRKGIQYPWNWASERFIKEYKDEIVFSKDVNNEFRIFHKNRFTGYSKDTTIKKFDTRKFGNELLVSILGQKKFDYPKSLEMMKWVISKMKNKNATVLDFFAGSGTTGHAVLELNREDGGSRNFILVTNNENNIGLDVTYERLYRIIEGKSTNGETFVWLKNNQPYSTAKLRVFDIKHFDISIGKTTEKSIDEIKEIAISNLKLLNPSYSPQNLDIYYDLSGLNPYKKEK
ncbi:site-specific DNA-methyltransferase [Candidatus Mycoplasma pogonae]